MARNGNRSQSKASRGRILKAKAAFREYFLLHMYTKYSMRKSNAAERCNIRVYPNIRCILRQRALFRAGSLPIYLLLYLVHPVYLCMDDKVGSNILRLLPRHASVAIAGRLARASETSDNPEQSLGLGLPMPPGVSGQDEEPQFDPAASPPTARR